MKSVIDNVDELIKNSFRNQSTPARPYQQCARCVMDTTGDDDITFDSFGNCNYCKGYASLEAASVLKGVAGERAFLESITRIKQAGAGKAYDCILGISGGVDSSYLAYICKLENIRPLLVHFDNGWNSEASVRNIQNIVKYTGFDLFTYVMDWEEFKDLQRSYIKASVIDLEVPSDNLIIGALHRIAEKKNINIILSGWNTVTEGIMPPSWNYSKKSDGSNLRSIQKAYGSKKLTKLPVRGFWGSLKSKYLYKTESFSLLEYIPYNRHQAIEVLEKEMQWQNYGGKHFESVFTRFYQGYILPKKFSVDKRKAHLSTMICSGQISRQEALQELTAAPYSEELQARDKIYVAKKLGFTAEAFEELLQQPAQSHYLFATDDDLWAVYFKFLRTIKGFAKSFNPGRPRLVRQFAYRFKV
jgi:N-acetyl sugar amidotransferase